MSGRVEVGVVDVGEKKRRGRGFAAHSGTRVEKRQPEGLHGGLQLPAPAEIRVRHGGEARRALGQEGTVVFDGLRHVGDEHPGPHRGGERLDAGQGGQGRAHFDAGELRGHEFGLDGGARHAHGPGPALHGKGGHLLPACRRAARSGPGGRVPRGQAEQGQGRHVARQIQAVEQKAHRPFLGIGFDADEIIRRVVEAGPVQTVVGQGVGDVV
ncbi:hypothetical protein DSECCO2_601800 [anaerobic digester metagenome]